MTPPEALAVLVLLEYFRVTWRARFTIPTEEAPDAD